MTIALPAWIEGSPPPAAQVPHVKKIAVLYRDLYRSLDVVCARAAPALERRSEGWLWCPDEPDTRPIAWMILEENR